MITKGIMAYSPTTLKKINELGFVLKKEKHKVIEHRCSKLIFVTLLLLERTELIEKSRTKLCEDIRTNQLRDYWSVGGSNLFACNSKLSLSLSKLFFLCQGSALWGAKTVHTIWGLCPNTHALLSLTKCSSFSLLLLFLLSFVSLLWFPNN